MRQHAITQSLANTRIAGHKPTPEFLADCEKVVEGRMSYAEAIQACAARAIVSTETSHPAAQPPLGSG
ncbi:antitoxin VbhA family protein [Variovorax paradoxus]|uniref:antitoxin VbhA family protein n=1 Tax=Variovorax paradoxus TaxID=34073 RepID=UPI003393BE0A